MTVCAGDENMSEYEYRHPDPLPVPREPAVVPPSAEEIANAIVKKQREDKIAWETANAYVERDAARIKLQQAEQEFREAQERRQQQEKIQREQAASKAARARDKEKYEAANRGLDAQDAAHKAWRQEHPDLARQEDLKRAEETKKFEEKIIKDGALTATTSPTAVAAANAQSGAVAKLSGGANGATAGQGAKIPVTAFIVSSIELDQGTRFAIVNGKTMQEGQQFGLQLGTQVYQVVLKKIEDDHVVLSRHDQEIVVPLRQN